MSQHFTIPIRTEHVITATIIMIFGLGMMSGSVLGTFGALYGGLIALLGFLYAYNQYLKQKKQTAPTGAKPT